MKYVNILFCGVFMALHNLNGSAATGPSYIENVTPFPLVPMNNKGAVRTYRLVYGDQMYRVNLLRFTSTVSAGPGGMIKSVACEDGGNPQLHIIVRTTDQGLENHTFAEILPCKLPCKTMACGLVQKVTGVSFEVIAADATRMRTLLAVEKGCVKNKGGHYELILIPHADEIAHRAHRPSLLHLLLDGGAVRKEDVTKNLALYDE